MKKLISTIIITIILSLNLSITPISYATDEQYDITHGTFNVKEILVLPDGEQQQKYFDTKENQKNKQAPIEAFAISVINFALAIMGSIAIILFIIAGFMMMTAQGESQKIDEAKDIIKYAVFGLIGAFFSYIIVLFVQSLFSG